MANPNIKFFRKDVAPSNPQEGFVWFNSTDNTIQLYKNGGWEKYSGKINNVTYVDGILTIIPHEGDSTQINLGNVANIEGLANRLGTLETNYTTLSGEFTTEKGKISTLQGEMVDVKAEVAKLEGITDKVTTYVVTKIGEEEKVRQEADQVFEGKISDLEGLVGTTAVATQISNAINNLDNGGVTGEGSYVDVTVTQVDGIVTGVTVSDGDLSTAIRDVAIDVLTETLVSESASEAFDELKEVSDWIKNHPGEAATINSNIATNTADIATIKGDIETINDTIEKNELTIAAALTKLDGRVNSLETETVKTVDGEDYITATTTDGSVIIKATTGTVANGDDALALASDVKSYVDNA